MAIIELSSSPEHLLVETDWAGYLEVLKIVGQRHLRVTYDRGKLELMTPSNAHEWDKTGLGDMLSAMMLELGIDYVGLGSTTFKSRKLARGFEPDECYWIANWEKAPRKGPYNPTRHPPPDLVIEVEMSRTVLNRLAVFAAFGVPEVWRLTRKGELKVLLLAQDGTYVEVERSGVFPDVPMEGIERHLRLSEELGTSRMIRQFLIWLRSLREA